MNRSDGARTTVGLPGTGLSWSAEPAAGLPNSRRLRSGQLDALKQTLLAVLQQDLLLQVLQGSSCGSKALLADCSPMAPILARTTALLTLIETPDAMEAYILRAKGQDYAKRLAELSL